MNIDRKIGGIYSGKEKMEEKKEKTNDGNNAFELSISEDF